MKRCSQKVQRPSQKVRRFSNRNEQWKEPELGTGIILTQLPNGPNPIEIQAKKRGNHLWSESTSLALNSKGVCYLQAWFIFGVITYAILGIYLITLVQKRRYRAREERLDRLVEKRTEELNLAKEAAEQSAHAKSEFLSTMSHELRTPMNAVIGLTHLLLTEELSDSQRTKLESLQFSAEHLLNVLNDILDFNKIESGKLELESRKFNLRCLLRNIHTGLQPKASQHEIELNYEVDERIPDLIVSDSTRLSQVLVNLLSNALKLPTRAASPPS